MVEFKGIEKFEVVSEEALQVVKGGDVVAPVVGFANLLGRFFGIR
ncbi:hypothetical protein RyT2_18630 [Pseudolactococcus yaeyamensis]